MTDTLFDIAPVVPRWKELAEEHKIYAHNSSTVEPDVGWSAWYFGSIESSEPDWRNLDPLDLIAEYCVLIEELGCVEYGPSEREAVIALVHRLQLEGWRTVSL